MSHFPNEAAYVALLIGQAPALVIGSLSSPSRGLVHIRVRRLQANETMSAALQTAVVGEP